MTSPGFPSVQADSPLSGASHSSDEAAIAAALARLQLLTSSAQGRPTGRRADPSPMGGGVLSKLAPAETQRPPAGWRPPTETPVEIRAGQLRARMTGNRDEPMIPLACDSLLEAGLAIHEVEQLVLRMLLSRGEATGRQVVQQLKLPLRLIEPVLSGLKKQQLICYHGSDPTNDFLHRLTPSGEERAQQSMRRTTYFGAAPVPLNHYRQAVAAQTLEHQSPTHVQLSQALHDMQLSPNILRLLGPAVAGGRGLFLYGEPGNGKTSISERICLSFGKYIWIPRAILIDSEIMRLFDPLLHEEAPVSGQTDVVSDREYDHRWVRIRRPTVVAGGELTLEMLEIQRNPNSNVNEAPLQLKSNCGVMLIDDFGRQRVPPDQLLNRWIVPLEKRHDYLNIHGGKKIQVPFDQLVILCTNLEPRDLADEAFLRRIPYKISVENPTEAVFFRLCEQQCHELKIPFNAKAIEYLLDRYFRGGKRQMRSCHPRDIMQQVRNYCTFHQEPLQLTKENIDFAIETYFSVM
jgi:hypothetical protein